MTAGPDAVRGFGPLSKWRDPCRLNINEVFQAEVDRQASSLLPLRSTLFFRVSLFQLSDSRLCRLVPLVFGKKCPCNPGRLVGHGYRDDPGRAACQQISDPFGSGCGFASCIAQHGGSADHQQSPDIAVALFGYPPKPLLAATGLLSWREPDPSGKFSTGLKANASGTVAAIAIAVRIPIPWNRRLPSA
jgi:hypothetical protein